MPIVQTVKTAQQFVDEFYRRDCGQKFTYRSLVALYEWLDAVYEQCSYELDVVALCSEWAEYRSTLEAAKVCGFVGDEEDAREWLSNVATIVETGEGGAVIVQLHSSGDK